MRLNKGIRRRLAPLMDNEPAEDRAAAQPAVHVAGQPGAVLRRRDRHGGQHLPGRPQWRPHADAMDRRSQCRLLPGRPVQTLPTLILDPIYNYQAINVEAASLHIVLTQLAALIHVRKKHPLFGRGTLRFVPCENRASWSTCANTRGRPWSLSTTSLCLCATGGIGPAAVRRLGAGRAYSATTNSRKLRNGPYFLSLASAFLLTGTLSIGRTRLPSLFPAAKVFPKTDTAARHELMVADQYLGRLTPPCNEITKLATNLK